MNYKKVIKDLKERNDKLQEQYRLRDIRCVHLEYENEMLKSDFEAQHELTEKYAEENKQLKDNWNKLKEYLHNVDVVVDYSENYDGRFINYDELLDKMQEIEKGSDSNGNNKTIFKQIN